MLNPELMRLCELTKPDTDKVNVQRLQMESGRAMIAIGDSDNFQEPIFKHVDEVRYGIK